MSVRFTQFLLPDGRRQEVEIDLDPKVEEKAAKIIAAGYKFEIEMLSTGDISATIADPKIDDDVAFAAIVPNGPDVPQAIEDMIKEFKF